MADQDYQDDQGQSGDRTQPRTQQFPQRAAASFNWRQKDESPRAEPQSRVQNDGRPGRGAYGSPRGSYNSGGPPRDREQSDTRLYVGNLLYSASKDDIAQFFSDNGFQIANISMSIDPETGKNPSYCFVDFATPDEASRAMNELNGQDVLGRTVRINPGMARRQGGEGGEGPRAYGASRGWGDRSQGQERTPYSRDAQSDMRAPRQQNQWPVNRSQREGPDNVQSAINTAGKRLYVGNLPAIDNQDDVSSAIHQMLDPLGVEITNISNLRAPHESKAGEPGDHHYCFVDLGKSEDVDTAIASLDNQQSPFGGDGSLRVNRAREREGGFRGGRGGFGDRGGFGGYQNRPPRTEGFRDWRKDGQ